MTGPHTEVSEYADELLSVPRAHLSLELRQDEEGLLLLYDGRTVVRCFLTRQGMTAAGFMARALGVSVPALGKTAHARVSTGVLYRAVGVASLDFDSEASYVLLERLLDEAEMQRGGSSAET
jgi:hypothetical protein